MDTVYIYFKEGRLVAKTPAQLYVSLLHPDFFNFVPFRAVALERVQYQTHTLFAQDKQLYRIQYIKSKILIEKYDDITDQFAGCALTLSFESREVSSLPVNEAIQLFEIYHGLVAQQTYSSPSMIFQLLNTYNRRTPQNWLG